MEEDIQEVLNGLEKALQATRRYRRLRHLHYDPKAQIVTASFQDNRPEILIRVGVIPLEGKPRGEEVVMSIMSKLDWMT